MKRKFEVTDDAIDNLVIYDKGDDFHLSAALRTEERVHFILSYNAGKVERTTDFKSDDLNAAEHSIQPASSLHPQLQLSPGQPGPGISRMAFISSVEKYLIFDTESPHLVAIIIYKSYLFINFVMN